MSYFQKNKNVVSEWRALKSRYTWVNWLSKYQLGRSSKKRFLQVERRSRRPVEKGTCRGGRYIGPVDAANRTTIAANKGFTKGSRYYIDSWRTNVCESKSTGKIDNLIKQVQIGKSYSTCSGKVENSQFLLVGQIYVLICITWILKKYFYVKISSTFLERFIRMNHTERLKFSYPWLLLWIFRTFNSLKNIIENPVLRTAQGPSSTSIPVSEPGYSSRNDETSDDDEAEVNNKLATEGTSTGSGGTSVSPRNKRKRRKVRT